MSLRCGNGSWIRRCLNRPEVIGRVSIQDQPHKNSDLKLDLVRDRQLA